MLKTISLTFTKSEWCELANAVASKEASVRNGDYGGQDLEIDPEEWANELKSIYKKLTHELEKNKILY